LSVMLALLLMTALLQDAPANPALGQWEGESICTVHPSPCHDEHVFYDVNSIPDGLGLDMYKIVDEKRQFMGSVKCSFDAEKNAVSCPMHGKDVWNFEIAANSMTGTLTHNGGTYRRINVNRKEAQ
jgi:hypothetical protein